MKSAANRPTHVTRGKVLDDLGFSPEQATALKFKAELYQAILKYSEKYSQKELQVILGGRCEKAFPFIEKSPAGPAFRRGVRRPRLPWRLRRLHALF